MYPSSNNDGMPHGSNQSDLSSYAAALQEREDELYQEGVKQVQTYKDIEYRINKLENQDERDVMFYKYIKGFTWWQIAQLMVWLARFKHVDVVDSAVNLDKLRGIGFHLDEIREMVGYPLLNTEFSTERALTKNYGGEGNSNAAQEP